MTLFFNLKNDPDLGTLAITGKYLVTASALECGSVMAVPYSAMYFTFPQSVLDWMKTNGNTINDLYQLANKVLSGEITTPKVTPSDVNVAVDMINRGFDKCRILIGFYATPPFTSR